MSNSSEQTNYHLDVPCKHGFLEGHFYPGGEDEFANWCEGGKKIVLRRFEVPHPVPVTGVYYLEVSDE